MKSIKTIAGDLLLLFYARQRQNGSIEDIFEFMNDKYGQQFVDDSSELKGMILTNDSKLSAAVLQVSENPNNAYGALRYLKDKGFLSCSEDRTNITEIFFNLRVTAGGIDIIEGIERGQQERNQFNVIFNIKLADNVSVDSLIKLELASLIKASLI